jgi:phosphoribosylformimino-5-aminoimidazole carboxamide ribotide isomerase
MVAMKLIPAIDIIDGVVVHAIRGERHAYQPLNSILVNSARPLDVVEKFKTLGFNEIYLADLNAIMGNGNNFNILQQSAKTIGLQLMIDAGTNTLERAEELLSYGLSKVILGTETLSSLSFVKKAIDCIGTHKIIVSLDLKQGKVLSKSGAIRVKSPLSVAAELQECGVSKLIVLDLARVGSEEGVDFPLLKSLIDKLNVEVLVGGGVRDIADLKALEKIGISGVLLASTLHSGKISMDQIKKYVTQTSL